MRPFLAILALCCLAAVVPPKTTKKVQSPKGAEFQSSFKTVSVYVPPQRMLLWNYVDNGYNPASNIVFIVRSATDLRTHPTNWPTLAVVKTNGYIFPLTAPMQFFRVWSSNTVTHEVSQ